jgi:prephenate dehydratase
MMRQGNKMKIVGYQGNQYSNSYRAALIMVSEDGYLSNSGDCITLMPFVTPEELISALKSGLCDYAVFPKTNSIVGTVETTRSALDEHSYFIRDEIILEIEHCLFRNNKDEKQVKIIMSHPQALAQCMNFIDTNKYKHIPTTGTAEAAKKISKDLSDHYCICSEEAGAIHGLELVSKDIATDPNNRTKFNLIQLDRPVEELVGYYSYTSESYLNKTVVPYGLNRCLKIKRINGILQVKGYIEGRKTPFFTSKIIENSYEFIFNRHFEPGRRGRVFLYIDESKLNGYFVSDTDPLKRTFGQMSIMKITENEFKRIISEKI